MRTFIKRFAAVAGVAVALTAGLGAPSASAAEPEQGCVGIPDFGGIYYYCVDENVLALLPRVSAVGETPVFVQVPAICYYLSCTQEGPVGTTLPVDVSVTSPSSDITVFEMRTNCYSYYGCYDDPYGYYNYYRITYYSSTRTCKFETDDSTLAIARTTVPCSVNV